MSCLRWMPRIVALVSVLGSVGATLADDIYRTVDAQGNVTYSDHAISPTSRVVTVDVIAADPQNAARLAKEQAVLNASVTEQEKSAKREATEEQRHEREAAAKDRQCQAARNRYASFAAGGRIWKADAQGNRVFYTDDEIAAERTRAKAEMDSACSP